MQNNTIFGSDVYFKSGRPYTDAIAWEADPTGVADSTSSIQAAHDYMKSTYGGGIVNLPPGLFNIAQGPLNLDNSCVSLIGAGRGATTLFSWHNDATVLSIGANWANAKIADLTIYGKGVNQDTGSFGATKSAIVMAANSGNNSKISDITVWGGYYAIDTAAQDCVFEDVFAGTSYGLSAINCTGAIWIRRGKFDTSTINVTPKTSTNNWKPDQAFDVGDLVVIQNYIICCVTAGITDINPPALANYGVNIPDGSAIWQLYAPQKYSALIYGPGARENNLDVCDMSGPYSTSLIVDSPTAFIEARSVIMDGGLSFNGFWGRFSGGHLSGGIEINGIGKGLVIRDYCAIDNSNLTVSSGIKRASSTTNPEIGSYIIDGCFGFQ